MLPRERKEKYKQSTHCTKRGKKVEKELDDQKGKPAFTESLLMKRLMSLALLLCLVGVLLLAFAIRLKHPGSPPKGFNTRQNWQDLDSFARQYHRKRPDETIMF